jgi:hypothetical protein
MRQRNKTKHLQRGMDHFGQRLYLTGIGSDVTEADLREFITKYGHHQPALVERVDLHTALPAYVVSFPPLEDGVVQEIARRIDGIYWHHHALDVHVI